MAESFAGSSVGMMPWCAVTLPSFQARERCERSSWPMIERSEGSVLSRLSRTVGTSANMLGQVAGVRAGVRRGLVRLVQGLGNLKVSCTSSPSCLEHTSCKVPRSNGSGGPSRTRSVSTDTTWALPAARICCMVCCATGCRRQRPASSVHASGGTHCAAKVEPPANRDTAMAQYGTDTKRAISRSRSTTSLSVGVCTRPTDSTPS